MTRQLGELIQGFATAHRSLLTVQDFVLTEPKERKLVHQYGAIPREVWTFIRDHGEHGRALVRQWYRDNGELIEHVLESDPKIDRDKSVRESLYNSGTSLVNSLVEHVERWSESSTSQAVLESESVAG